jgi:beta-galactosidase
MHRRDFLRAASAATITAAAGDAAFAKVATPAATANGTAAVGSQVAAPVDAANPLVARTRMRLSLDRGWRFHLGDIPFPRVTGHGWTYANAKAGSAWGAASPNHDDSTWRELDLPHDWVVEGSFDKAENPSQGYRPRGVAWYRRALRLEAQDRGKHIELQFDGIATHATIWFNGTVVNRNWSGYNSIYVDITPFAYYGNRLNNIVVRVDANPMEGWWYEGGGIYRHVWLVKRSAVHIATDGVHANPRLLSERSWTVPVEAALRNIGEQPAHVDMEALLIGPDGRTAGHARVTATVAPLGETTAALPITIDDPQLWTIEQPALYRVRVTVRQGETIADEAITTLGFRTLRFDPDQGFFLNGQATKIHGVCVHQDHAGVGVAVPDALWEFRLARLKELGANAIRCAHNAPAVELLDAADRMGMLVMDENRNFNVSPDYMRQLEWLIRRDRNHPSIILWSVFNEEPMQGTEAGYQMVRRMAAAVKALDTTRPVTAAMNDGMFSPSNVSQAVDVVGFNYQQDRYDAFHAKHPLLPVFSSEDTSAFMTRGEYQSDRTRNILAAYDQEPSSWGATHRDAWRAIAGRAFVAGTFVWTGFDYRGEPTPFEWPSASSFFGIMDLCGFPKTAFFLHQAHWIKDRPILQLVPHWNWPGREGEPIKVMALSNAQSVALFLDGKPLGEKTVDPIDMVSWEVPYAPGKLEAVGFQGGREVSRMAVATTGAAVAVRLSPYRATLAGDGLAGDGMDAQPITVSVVDREGRPVPANLPIEFDIEGGRIIGLGNGDPNSHEPEKGTRRSLFNGLAQVIVQSTPASSGVLRLSAHSAGLESARLDIDVIATPDRPFVAPMASVQILNDWRVSPPSQKRPDPQQKPADTDMNSWGWSRGDELRAAVPRGGWTLFRTRFQPYASVQKTGGRVVFTSLSGRAEVWLDGVLLGRKRDDRAERFEVVLQPADGERTLIVLLQSQPGQAFGFADIVTIEY